MKISRIVNSILEKPEIWKYYNQELTAPNINNELDCFRFILNYIKQSEKTGTILYENAPIIFKSDPRRVCHIVSAFIMGLWFFNNKRVKVIRKAVVSELSKLKCFQHEKDIERQFSFVWYMATLFHDLAYVEEEKVGGECLPEHEIPENNVNGEPTNESIPRFYKNVYKKYYEYRKQKEHGIYAGIVFDCDICAIREKKNTPYSDSELDWRVELEELYHYVAWIILAHNIWLIRDNDPKIKEYSNLQELIMSSEKNELDQYVEYKFKHKDYPLFSLFCIVDAIEFKKKNYDVTDVDVQLFKNKIVVRSRNEKYLKEVFELNEWFAPVEMENEKVTIFINWI